ncbi:hypothetical protein E0L36_05615 [Streptomyces sp. AJS327]|uniref:transmembrane-type terpene cyclase n=1 Tax=Streptomyces sp. AJS327 TaxID=2545265 RepID=UPI0015DFB5AA|nr:hypothetical protein [Streptomyces sp. AJS327]MBA0050391.1 hypothetical protein [Streptomyces sp. AJS327]
MSAALAAAAPEALAADAVGAARLALTGVCGLGWVVAYAAMVRVGVRDRIHGIPVVALTLNISWEFQYSVFGSSGASVAGVAGVEETQILATVFWFVVDCGLLYTVLRFGPAQFAHVPRPVFHAGFVVTLCLSYAAIAVLSRQFDDGDVVLTSFGINTAMAGMFLAMLASRGSSRGQSLVVAVAKLVGTAAACASWAVDTSAYPGPWMPFCAVACLVLDTGYLVALALVKRAERRAAARPALTLPGPAEPGAPERRYAPGERPPPDERPAPEAHA